MDVVDLERKIEEDEWRDVPGYEGLYRVSDVGEVKSFLKWRGTNQRMLKPAFIGHGYLFVVLSKNGKKKNSLIHRLVASSFVPNIDKNPCVNHKNGIKTDNCVENLEWCTLKENNVHAWANGLGRVAVGEESGASKLTEERVLEIRKTYKPRVYNGTKELSEKYGVGRTTIYNIVNRKTWRNL